MRPIFEFKKIFEQCTILIDIHKKSSFYQKMQNNKDPNSISYRAWPIFLLAFVRLFYVSIFERALSNYLLFDVGIRPSTLGFISSAVANIIIHACTIG